MKALLKNLSYSICSNLINFLLAVVVTFVSPKILTVQQYGYFQLYLLYSGYIGVLHFGWADGIFLKYGGQYYNKLDKKTCSGQCRLNFIFEIIISIVFLMMALLMPNELDKKIILCCVALEISFCLPCTLLQYLLQTTNRVKEYAISLLVGRFFYAICVGLIVISNGSTYIALVAADMLGKLITFIGTFYYCRDIIFSKPPQILDAVHDAILNIKIGVALVIANFAGSLIIGVVQLAIEEKWSVEVFGKIAFTISASNFLMVLIRAIALVVFPVLKRIPANKLPQIYSSLRIALMIPLFGMLMVYYPARKLLSLWLPQYNEGLRYMALLFPMCIFESKTSLLIETYIKAIRKERWLLETNVLTLLIAILSTIVSVFILQNLTLAVISIVVLLAFRCIRLEMKLTKEIHVAVYRDILLEIIMSITFIICSGSIQGFRGFLTYLIAYLSYLIVNRNRMQEVWITIKSISGNLLKKGG